MRDIINLLEGGNVFKNPDGQPATQRINQSDVKPTIMWLDQVVPGLDLTDNMLGSTGLKPTSGDLDLAIDSNKVSKDEFYNTLVQWCTSHGLDPKDWVKKSGISVHFKTPISGDQKRGYVQTDFMFLRNVPFSKFILRGDINSQYKGALRNIMLNSIAKSMGFKLNQNDGLQDRATNKIISDDPEKIAQILLNKNATANDLLSVENIMAALANDPAKQNKIADFKAHMEREGQKFDDQLAETVAIEDNTSFIARLRDRIVNQGMQPIFEGARIEHPEDLVFDGGAAGIRQAITGLQQAAKSPVETTTVKWDGKPAIIFGRDPKGKFVLTDKAGFGAKGYNGMTTSPEAIEQMMLARGGERGELIGIYKKLFPLLNAAVPKDYQGYIQGDLLYTNTPKLVNGNYVFTPNTVNYSVPAETPLGKAIGQSQAAVAIHTSLAAPGAAPEPIRAAELNQVPGLLILDPTIKPPKKALSLNARTMQALENLLKANGPAIDATFNPQELRSRKISNLPALMKTYINTRVRSGSYDNLLKGFVDWVQTKEPAKAPRIMEWLRANSKGVAALFQSFLWITSLKNSLVQQLDVDSHDVQADIGGERGHEGYVGNGMKFVNRDRFSRANFAKNNPNLS